MPERLTEIVHGHTRRRPAVATPLQLVRGTLAIAGALCTADLRAVARAGYRTVIDLRAQAEPVVSGLAPHEEAVCAALLGLRFVHVPVAFTSLDASRVAAVRQAIHDGPGPVLLHCATGRRAAVFAVLHVALEEHWKPEACWTRLCQLGFAGGTIAGLRHLVARLLGEDDAGAPFAHPPRGPGAGI